PGEVAVAIRLRAERKRWVAVRDQAVLKVIWQRADWADMRSAGHRPQAVASRPAAIRRLCPGMPTIEREVDARGADPIGERAGGWVARVACLYVDLLVGACGKHRRVVCIDRDRGFVLLILSECRGWAADRNQAIAPLGKS